MPAISVPNEDKKVGVSSKGENFGNILYTKNIDFDKKPGSILLSERLYRVYDDDDDGDFRIPKQIVRSDAGDGTDRWWMITQSVDTANGVLFKTDSDDPLTSWAQDAFTDTPTDARDQLAVFGKDSGNDRLITMRTPVAGDLAMLGGSTTWDDTWWTGTLSQSSLTAGRYIDIHTFLNLLLVVEDNTVHTVDESLVVTTERLQWPEQYKIAWIEQDATRVYFGTRHVEKGEALIFPWDGVSEQYDEPLRCYARATMAGQNVNGVLHTINTRGQVLFNNGQELEEVARFPNMQKANQWEDLFASNENDLMVHRNGMEVIDGHLHMLMNNMVGDNNAQVFEDMPSGVWALSENGLYQKYSLSKYDGVTNDEWGDVQVNAVGALKQVDVEHGRLLAGALLYEDASTTGMDVLLASQTKDSADQRGYLVTVPLTGNALRELWTKLNLFLKTHMENATDRVIIKYRTVKDKNFEEGNFANTFFTGTWDSSNDDTFTINDADGVKISVGDEIEILRGNQAGAIAHVSSITNTSGNNYTIVIDEEVPNVDNSGTFIFRPQNWTKLGTFSDQALQHKIYTVAKRSSWIQLKAELRGTDTSPELEKFLQEYVASR